MSRGFNGRAVRTPSRLQRCQSTRLCARRTYCYGDCLEGTVWLLQPLLAVGDEQQPDSQSQRRSKTSLTPFAAYVSASPPKWVTPPVVDSREGRHGGRPPPLRCRTSYQTIQLHAHSASGTKPPQSHSSFSNCSRLRPGACKMRGAGCGGSR